VEVVAKLMSMLLRRDTTAALHLHPDFQPATVANEREIP
jgi:hypothetical protein